MSPQLGVHNNVLNRWILFLDERWGKVRAGEKKINVGHQMAVCPLFSLFTSPAEFLFSEFSNNGISIARQLETK